MPSSLPLRNRLQTSLDGLILDGGLASELGRRGLDLNHKLWSAKLLLDDPEAIASVTHDFGEAGADIVATATYQASFPGLEQLGLSREQSRQIFRDAVTLAIESIRALENAPLVAASIGPYGAFLADGSEYRGNYGLSETELADFHRERIEILAETEADLLAFETFPSAPEIFTVADLLSNHSQTEAWISCSCKNGQELWDGTPIELVAERIGKHEQISAFGVNCVDPVHTAELISRIGEAAPDTAIIVYPNAGRGWDAEAEDWKGFDSPEQFADRAQEWRKQGAAIIGGCCQTTPEHIHALAESR